MGKTKLKSYGRTKVNKLDWLIAIVSVVIAVAALWMMIGISVANAGELASTAFMDLVLGLGFIANAAKHGQSAVISAYCTVIIYESLALLVLGTLFLLKKGKKDRVPGLVAEFVAAIGLSFYLCFFYEFSMGGAAGSVQLVWPIGLIVFMVALFVLMVVSVYMTFSGKSVELKEQAAEEEPAEEEAKEEEPEEEKAEEPAEEPKEEEKAEEPAPEQAPEEEEEPEEEEFEEEEESEEPAEEELDEDGNPFSNLGKRNKRVPFENKLKRCSPETRARYKMIVAALREYDFNDRKSIPGETFSYKRERLIFLTITGTTLKVHFKLDPKEFEDSPIPAKDASDTKKYEDVPVYLKIKSDLAARRAIKLGARIAEERQVPKK